jgi:TfoX/Sxy family transcriptional regulator of competence genes
MMAYDEGIAQRIRDFFAHDPGVVEKKMFGGLAFMVQGHMCVGVSADDLMVRVGPEQYEKALQMPHARKMDFIGRPLRGFIYVSEEGIEADEDLQAWVDRALTFVHSLPPK